MGCGCGPRGPNGRCITARTRSWRTRSIYILQNVVGDSGGANARYSLTEDKECAIPHDLPENLEATGSRRYPDHEERDGRGVA